MRLLIAILSIALTLGVAVRLGTLPDGDAVWLPACYEDAVIVGGGDFVDGYWQYYVCGPSWDDLETEFEAGPDWD